MEIKDFVESILVDLDAAVESARSKTSRDIHFSQGQGSNRTVMFDIAVTTEESKTKGGKAEIKVLGIVDGGADIGSEKRNSIVSHVSFGVNISPSTKNEQERSRAAIQARNGRNNDGFNF